MKNIYHITENVAFESGGVRTVLLLLHQYLIEKNKNSQIITNRKEDFDNFIQIKSNKPWCYSAELMPFLNKLNNDSIFHLHGVYSYNQYISSEIAINKGISYIVSPHGMLEPWILNKNSFKKKIYLKLILNKILYNAKTLHSITPLEKESIFQLTNHKNIVEIPNLFDFSLIPNEISNRNYNEDYLVFVGRIDKKKGIELIINALSKISSKNLKIKILGAENEYSNYLKSIISKLNLNDKVEFLGAVYSEEKYKIIANSRALIAPSYSEAIGMVNLEAAACKTPVITTFQTGIKKEWGINGGKLINPNELELEKAITECLSWNESERKERGESLYRFAYENYSWEKNGKLWDELYDSL